MGGGEGKKTSEQKNLLLYPDVNRILDVGAINEVA